ncbi:hypothetical protein [Sphingomonas sp. LM7]|uniref:hypothetical protein n=1 Tax=Sphingomonas sp. LM7 TaxID=1938607 RepID=UPI000983D363|nr:hypothetical protein [Sphingomonas sp. LM7]AQR72865.1 hypothetical protein BXU08_03505 [Sphingomonas sp. LM7]
MKLNLNDRTCSDDVLPHPSPTVQRRMLATVHTMGALIHPPGSAGPKLQGCLVLPLAGIILAGTACARPLLFAEYDALARATNHDVIILRHDTLRGTTFDIKLRSEPRWYRRYLGTPVENGMRMAPDIGAGPVLRATAFGLEILDNRAASDMPPRMSRRIASACLVEA